MSHPPPRLGDAQATRRRLLTLMRQRPCTIDGLAGMLGLTDNAVRFHIAGLERDGSVERAGVRKPDGAGKPAFLYALTRETDISFSRAYAPVLVACLAELRDDMSSQALIKLLRRVGERLARSTLVSSGPLEARVGDASALLNQLGGLTTVEEGPDSFRIVGLACPLGAAVAEEPCLCHAVESLLTQVVGTEVTEQCDRSGRPRCCFAVRREAERTA